MPNRTSHPRDVDLRQTRRQFLVAREQAAQASTDRYRRVVEMRDWPRSNAKPARRRPSA
jgi:hypothetical protein